MSSDYRISNIIKFPEGDFLLVEGEVYAFYKPENSDTAYGGYGSYRELMGKNHLSLVSSSDDFDRYDLTYEIEDNELISARLITPFKKSAGTLASEQEVSSLNKALEDGSLTLKRHSHPSEIDEVYQAKDGFTLLTIRDSELGERHFRGQIGNLEEFKTEGGIQGGNWSSTTSEDGITIEIEYKKHAIYDERVLKNVDIEDPRDFAAFGIDKDKDKPHLDPFSPELTAPKPS